MVMRKNDLRIYCRDNGNGNLQFYVTAEGQEYYLFSQRYHMSVHKYFRKGVSYRQAKDYTQAVPVRKAMSRIPGAIRYIEKAYQVEILEQTKKRNNRKRGYAKYPAAV